MAGFNINDLLNAKSKGAAVQAEGPAEQEQEFKVTMLDVEDLMPSKDNFYSTENIDELAMSIELVGHIEQNLVVKPEAHGKYEVVAGHRRRLAALKLVQEGKEEYRKVPCLIKKESDTIKDKLSLIFTNATARQLTDWEKVQQAKELKEILTEYKKALQEENKDKPKEEREKMGRIRDIVAQMLNTSTTQVGRMEAIENNLSQEFKDELEKGNINISTAHELSRLDEEGQKKAYEKYEEKGELHISDVKEEPKAEITDEQAEQVQKAIKEAVAKGRIKAPGFFTDPIIKDAYCSAEWTGPSAGQLDPTKEVEAAEKRVQGGYSTREREARELTGTDFYKNIKQRKREEELLKEVTGGAKTDAQTVENINGREESDTENNPDNDGGQTEEETEE